MSKNSAKKPPNGSKPEIVVRAADISLEGKCQGVPVHPNGNNWQGINRHWNLCMDCDPKAWRHALMEWVKKKNYRPTDPAFFCAIANALDKNDIKGGPVFEIEIPKIHLADPGVSLLCWRYLPLRQKILIMENHGDMLLSGKEGKMQKGGWYRFFRTPRNKMVLDFIEIHAILKKGRSKSNYVDAFMDVLAIFEVNGL